MNKKKILLFITQLELAGAQKALAVLARGLIAKGYDVDCFCFYDKTNCKKELEEKYGVSFTPLIKGNKSFLGFLISLIKLIYILKKNKYDLIQTYTHFSNIIIPPLALVTSKTIVITSQRGRIPPIGKVISKIDSLIQNSSLVHEMVCVSQGLYESCIDEQGINPKKLSVIANGIDVNEKDSKKYFEIDVDGKVVFTTVARLHEQKGHRYLVDAIARVNGKIENAVFLFVGGGELTQEIKAYAAELGLQDKILFLGARNDVDNILMHSDAFILPSLWEGMPNCVLEAMKHSLPVIATSVEGSRELVVTNETGLLVKPKNVEELSDAIVKLYENESLRNNMGKKGVERVTSDFSLENYINKFHDIYCLVLNSTKA